MTNIIDTKKEKNKELKSQLNLLCIKEEEKNEFEETSFISEKKLKNVKQNYKKLKKRKWKDDKSKCFCNYINNWIIIYLIKNI